VSINPYESSTEFADARPGSHLSLPAGILLGISLLSAIKWVTGGLYAIFYLSSRVGRGIVLYGSLDVGLGVISLLIAFGSYLMLRRKSFGAAWTTAIAATIPCLSPCIVLGMPIGIWIMLLLRRPDVQAEFLRDAIH